MKKLLNKQTWSRSDSRLSVPQTHPAAWKSSPLKRETQGCTSVPAVSTQHCNVPSPQCTNPIVDRPQEAGEARLGKKATEIYQTWHQPQQISHKTGGCLGEQEQQTMTSLK